MIVVLILLGLARSETTARIDGLRAGPAPNEVTSRIRQTERGDPITPVFRAEKGREARISRHGLR